MPNKKVDTIVNTAVKKMKKEFLRRSRSLDEKKKRLYSDLYYKYEEKLRVTVNDSEDEDHAVDIFEDEVSFTSLVAEAQSSAGYNDPACWIGVEVSVCAFLCVCSRHSKQTS